MISTALQFLGNRSSGRRKLVMKGKNEASVLQQIWQLSSKTGRTSHRAPQPWRKFHRKWSSSRNKYKFCLFLEERRHSQVSQYLLSLSRKKTFSQWISSLQRIFEIACKYCFDLYKIIFGVDWFSLFLLANLHYTTKMPCFPIDVSWISCFN